MGQGMERTAPEGGRTVWTVRIRSSGDGMFSLGMAEAFSDGVQSAFMIFASESGSGALKRAGAEKVGEVRRERKRLLQKIGGLVEQEGER